MKNLFIATMFVLGLASCTSTPKEEVTVATDSTMVCPQNSVIDSCATTNVTVEAIPTTK